jgi:hypothetical protein
MQIIEDDQQAALRRSRVQQPHDLVEHAETRVLIRPESRLPGSRHAADRHHPLARGGGSRGTKVPVFTDSGL